MSNLYSFDPCTDRRWPGFLENRDDASVFHTAGWLEALRRTYGYEPTVYTISPPGAELKECLVFCQIKTWIAGKRLVSIPFSDHASLLTDDQKALEQLLSFLKQQVDARICRYLEIRPGAPLDKDPTGLDKSAVFYWHRLHLDRDLGVLYRSFHKSCVQRKIRRAGKEGLSYAEGTSEELLQQFYRLLLVTNHRHRVVPQPISWFRNLIDCLGESIRIRVVSMRGVPVASIITLTYKSSMVYKYGCSDARYNRLGGMMLLLWRAIQDAKHNGLDELDMGRSDCNNSGLISFKEHWGAERSKLAYWAYPANLRPDLNRWDLRAARRVFSMLPTAVLSATGRLLYRHMG